MTERGVFGVSRGIWDDPDFRPEPFTEREAFMWLISEAAWRSHRIHGPRGPVPIHRGEVAHSVRFMAVTWRWSKSRVARFIDKLKKRDIIRDVHRDTVQVYFIKNYNKFQIAGLPKRDTARDAERDSSGTAAGQQRDKLEEGKEGKEGKGTSSLRSDVRRAPAAAPDNTPRGELTKVLDDERADAVLDHRKRIRKPLTAHAAKLLARKFNRCPDPNAAAEAMISNGWQGFEPEWLENLTAKRSPNGRGPPQRSGNAFARLASQMMDDRHEPEPEPHHGATLDLRTGTDFRRSGT